MKIEFDVKMTTGKMYDYPEYTPWYEDEAYLFALQTGESRDVAFSARLRALLISNLITLRAKTGIGRLSAYCGLSTLTQHKEKSYGKN